MVVKMKIFMTYLFLFFFALFNSGKEIMRINSNQDDLIGISVNNAHREEVMFQIKYNYKSNEVFFSFGESDFLVSPQLMFTFKKGRLVSISDIYLSFENLDEIRVFEEREVRNRKRHGVTKYFYKNGNSRYEMNFTNGILFGKYRVFDEEGNLVFENDITNENKKVKWYENGQLVEADNYQEVWWLSD